MLEFINANFHKDKCGFFMEMLNFFFAERY